MIGLFLFQILHAAIEHSNWYFASLAKKHTLIQNRSRSDRRPAVHIQEIIGPALVRAVKNRGAATLSRWHAGSLAIGSMTCVELALI